MNVFHTIFAFFRCFTLVLLLAFLPNLSWADEPLGSVNINAASAEDIAGSLTGVGFKKAQAVVAYRDANGEFQAIEELSLVKGIGPRTVEKNREKITLQ